MISKADWKTLYVPIFYFRQKRYRARLRLIRWGGFHRQVGDYREGRVILFWIGFVLLTAMVDQQGDRV